MPFHLIATLAFLAGSVTTAQVTRDAPSYSAAGIVNAASNDPNALAPYTIITINGTNLAWDSHTMQPSDVINGNVPVALPNAGVRVLIGTVAAGLLSVSPTQLTVLIPGDLIAGPIPLQVMLDGVFGAEVLITLSAVGPGVYPEPGPPVTGIPQFLRASRPDGAPVTGDAPLLPGAQFVLYATGLGMCVPPLGPTQIPADASALSPEFLVTIFLNNVPIDPLLLKSVTFLPGQAGMFQILIQLPDDAPANPELRVDVNGLKSAPGFLLRVQP